MKNNTAEIKLKISLPYGTPNQNGTIYTKEAIESALINPQTLPLMFQTDPGDALHLLGQVKLVDAVEWDDENQVCHIILNGRVYNAGPYIMAHEIQDGKITNFELRGIGLSE